MGNIQITTYFKHSVHHNHKGISVEDKSLSLLPFRSESWTGVELYSNFCSHEFYSRCYHSPSNKSVAAEDKQGFLTLILLRMRLRLLSLTLVLLSALTMEQDRSVVPGLLLRHCNFPSLEMLTGVLTCHAGLSRGCHQIRKATLLA